MLAFAAAKSVAAKSGSAAVKSLTDSSHKERRRTMGEVKGTQPMDDKN